MVSRLIPHRSSNILLCSYFCPSSINSFTVFSLLPVFRRVFHRVLIPVRLPSIPRMILLLTTVLVPSLIVGYRPTHSYTVWITSCWDVWLISVLRFFFGDSSLSIHSMEQFINWALIFLKSIPCSGFVITFAQITPAGQSSILTSSLSTLSLIKKNFA